MARQFQVNPGGGIILPTGCVDDEAVSASNPLGVTKVRHRHRVSCNFGFEKTGTPTTKEFIVHRAKAPGTVANVGAMLTLDGSTTALAFDLKKNGTTVLSGTIDLTHSTGDGVYVSGTIGTPTYSAGDVFSMVMTMTNNTGAQGPLMDAEFDEAAV